MDLNQRVAEKLGKGLCCTQIVMDLSLEMRGREEPFTIRALGALGGGMYARKNCGALTGGACMLASYFPREEGEGEPTGYRAPIQALVEWFEGEYGSVECRDLVENTRESMMAVCPGLIAGTFAKCVELLEEAGIDPEE